jgi:hypothetical protein
MLTFDDAIQNVLDYLGAKDDDGQLGRDAKRAVRAALTTLADDFNWSYYFKEGRLNLNADGRPPGRSPST